MVIASRQLLMTALAACVVLTPLRAQAQWWSSKPADFEACADVAEKATVKEGLLLVIAASATTEAIEGALSSGKQIASEASNNSHEPNVTENVLESAVIALPA